MWKSLDGSRSGLPRLSTPFAQLASSRELRRHEMLARGAIEHEEVAIARRLQHELAVAAAERGVDQHRRLRRIPVVGVVRRRREMPGQLAGVDVQRHQRAGVEIVAGTPVLRRVGGRRVGGAGDVEPRRRIEGSGNPHVAAAMFRRLQARPGLEPGIAGILRRRVPGPLHLTGVGVVGLHEAWCVEVVARADEHVVVDDDRRRGREVLRVQLGDLLGPALFAGPAVEADQVVVRCRHVEPLLPHAHAPVAGVRAAQRLPDVVPEQAPVARIDRPGVVERRDIELAVDGDRRTDDAGRTSRGLVEGAGAEAADRPGHLGTGVAEAAEAAGWRRGHTGRDAGDPPQPELADVAAIDLCQRAVAPARVVPRIRQPLVGEGAKGTRRRTRLRRRTVAAVPAAASSARAQARRVLAKV